MLTYIESLFVVIEYRTILHENRSSSKSLDVSWILLLFLTITILNSEGKFNNIFDQFVIPVYTVLVVLYLSGLYLEVDFSQLWKKSSRKQDVTCKGSESDIKSVVIETTVPTQVLPSGTSNEVLEKTETNRNDLSLEEERVGSSAYECEDKNAPMPINLTGVYQLVSNHNVDAFLEAQGVPWALRRAATSAKPVHKIKHEGNSITIRIEAVGFKSQTSYVINGPPLETDVRGRIFSDQFRYYEPIGNDGQKRCRGVISTKTCKEENYVVTVVRELSEDNQRITLTSTATFAPEKNKSPVIGKQIFDRIE